MMHLLKLIRKPSQLKTDTTLLNTEIKKHSAYPPKVKILSTINITG